jgi:hypothetical protein
MLLQILVVSLARETNQIESIEQSINRAAIIIAIIS